MPTTSPLTEEPTAHEFSNLSRYANGKNHQRLNHIRMIGLYIVARLYRQAFQKITRKRIRQRSSILWFVQGAGSADRVERIQIKSQSLRILSFVEITQRLNIECDQAIDTDKGCQSFAKAQPGDAVTTGNMKFVNLGF